MIIHSYDQFVEEYGRAPTFEVGRWGGTYSVTIEYAPPRWRFLAHWRWRQAVREAERNDRLEEAGYVSRAEETAEAVAEYGADVWEWAVARERGLRWPDDAF